MPYSYGYFKTEVAKYIIKHVPSGTKILDVGAGSGTYGMMLNAFYPIDALEIFDKYVEQFKLHEIYQNVHVGDIRKFIFKDYDFLIFGDVWEHLSVADAKYLLAKIQNQQKKCLIAIPYKMEQGEVNGNKYEAHLQSGLTHDIFIDRYPYMKLLFMNEAYGYYINF